MASYFVAIYGKISRMIESSYLPKYSLNRIESFFMFLKILFYKSFEEYSFFSNNKKTYFTKNLFSYFFVF